MSSDVYLTAQHEFKGDEYLVTVRLSLHASEQYEDEASFSELLTVEVENVGSCEQWSGEFTAKYLEELTGKTGNFKPFPTFVHMLKSALEKRSSTVSLELLTLADLEQLRRQKGASFASLGKSVQTSNRRYLILTYNVEFDRIHYPLVLQSRGQLDAIKLLTSLRSMQQEAMTVKQGRTQVRDTEVTKLKKKYDDLLDQNEELEGKVETLQDQLRFAEKGPDSKKTEVLKSVMRTLESDLVQERTKHQRYVNQKRDLIRGMQEELDELRASEGVMRTRVKYLTNELATYKRGQSHGSFQPRAYRTARTSSTERGRSLSPKPRPAAEKARKFTDNGWKATPPKKKSAPKPSFSSSRKPRFDPTAYVREKAEKQQQAHQRGRSVSRSPSPRLRGGTRSRSHSADSFSGRRQASAVTPATVLTSQSYGQRRGSQPSSRNSSLERRSSSLERLGKPPAPGSSRSGGVPPRHPPTGSRRGGGSGSRGNHAHHSPAAWDVSPASVRRGKSAHSKQPTPRALNDSPDEDGSLLHNGRRIADINARLSHLRAFMQTSFPEKKR